MAADADADAAAAIQLGKMNQERFMGKIVDGKVMG